MNIRINKNTVYSHFEGFGASGAWKSEAGLTQMKNRVWPSVTEYLSSFTAKKKE